MNISSSFNNSNNQYHQGFRGVPEKALVLPGFIGKFNRWAGTHVGIPEQKLFLASSAFVLQPFIDLKYAAEEVFRTSRQPLWTQPLRRMMNILF